ncbi:MAG: GNAT family N-acetyltransferase [Gammaproteobacteria bacterium]|nr:GNAT family N-acetyltransferase [Gammaproteobacteria bacterium]MCH9745076.1 GNAT family N-acetyltransferase [Gammaproteobacteria bacterium]
MSITYRQANADDADIIAELTVMTAGGISDFMLNDLFPDTTTEEMLKLAILDEDNPMCYNNTLLAVENDKIIGATNYYPASQHLVPEIMRAFIPQERLDHMKNFYETRIDDSLYIHTLAVLPEYRNTPAALDMCHLLEGIAKEKNLKYLSAHVWADNTPVVTALKFAGFQVDRNVEVKRHELLPHDDGMLLMKSPEIQ